MATKPHPIDVHVGGRARFARLRQGMSQGSLANAAGVTFQQIQKYEKGTNRISASRLFELATALNVDVSYFFQDIESVGARPKTAEWSSADVRLMQSVSKIKDARLKQKIRAVIDSLAELERETLDDEPN